MLHHTDSHFCCVHLIQSSMEYSCPYEFIEFYQIDPRECKNTHDQTSNHQVHQELKLNPSHHFYQIEVFMINDISFLNILIIKNQIPYSARNMIHDN